MSPDHRAAVLEAVADVIVSHRGDRPTRVAVDGITAAGKTTFADDLDAVLGARGIPCLRVSMDGFHHPRAVRYRQGRDSADGYYEDAYDFPALRRELLDPLGPDGDRVCRTRVIDLATDEITDDPRVPVAADVVLVVDGSFLQRPELDGAWDVAVFLDADFAAAEARGVARDAARLGSREEATQKFRDRYHAAQRRYLAEVDPTARADVVVRHDDPANPVLLAAPTGDGAG